MINRESLYFILETAFHHEGDVQFLSELITGYSDVNANAIKFHLLFDVDDYMVAEHPAIDTLRNISVRQDDWTNLFDLVSNQGKEIVLLCNDLKSLKWANSIQHEYPISAIELHSTGLNDIFLLKEAVNFNKHIILGIGGSTFNEIKYAVDFLLKNGKKDIVLMHGFQNYPTNASDINFNRLNLMRTAFDHILGYADHTDPEDKNNILFSVLPVVMGVTVIEKHVTNVPGIKRIDSQAAVSVDQMKMIIELAQECYKSLGTSTLDFSEAEMNYGNTGPMKKAIVARQTLLPGELITLDKIAFKRTEASSPLNQMDLAKILGSTVTQAIQENEIIAFHNIAYQFKKAEFNQFFISNNS